MGVVSSMSTAISGLEANGEMLSVISDNIVNANTTGFKSSRTEFNSLVASDLMQASGGEQIGQGARAAGITSLFTQGSLTRTNRATDMAINGTGFFVVKGDNGTAYTRDGSFRFDKDGWMTTLSGHRVQAYRATPDGKIGGRMEDVRLDFKAIPAKATAKVDMFVNLDARMPPGTALNLDYPEESSQFTTAMQVYDSVGNAHSVSLYFNRTTEANWEWYAMVDGSELNGGTNGKAEAISKGTLTFDQTGKLMSSDQQVLNTSFSGGAIPDQALEFNFGDPIDKEGTGQKGTTQYGSNNVTFRNTQDGYSAGTLSDTIVDSDGIISGVYSNGENRLLGQMAVARFDATEKLAKVGNNQFIETPQSGQPLAGKPKTNGRGAIQTRSLEHSNVDLASEFVEMIRAQRGFQASAKSITSADQMLEEVINLRGR
ncbi:flagellar hook protein FlgE [bacterium]|nr:flagellar hook protein FlgE [bacterium]